MKKYNLIFIFVALFANSFAQVSGYMGKRFVVGYSSYLMFGPKGPGPISAAPRHLFSSTINNTHCLNFDYAIKQRINVCLSVQYFKTGIAYDKGKEGFFVSESGTGEYCYPDRVAYRGNFGVPIQLSSVNIGLGYKLFHRGCIAPIGGYQKFEFLLLFEKVKYDNKKFMMADPDNYNNPDIPIAAYGLGEYNYRNVALTYTVGKQRVFFNCITVDYGLRMGITPAGIGAVVFDDLISGIDTIEGRYRKDSRKRVFRHQLINFHLGIGFLAF